MTKFFAAICFLFLVAGCGGSSGGDNSPLNGFWRGELVQTSLSCGGMFVGACTGCKVRDIFLAVTGADGAGSTVEIADDECVFTGVQTEEGVEATPSENCAESTLSMRLSNREDGTAAVSIRFDTNTPDVVGCRGTYGASLERS